MTCGGDKDNPSDDAPIPGETAPNDAGQMQENVDLAQTLADQLSGLGHDMSEVQENLDAAQATLDNAADAGPVGDDGNGGDNGGGDWTPY